MAMRPAASAGARATDGVALDEHPAVRAWSLLRGPDHTVAAVEELSSKEKAAVWRLHRAGPDGADVIAKVSRARSAVTERAIYERVLPRVDVSAPACFGCNDGADGALWLFIEDAGDEAFRYDDAAQQELAARWLARLHVEGASVADAASLPDRGPRHFRERLAEARDLLKSRLAAGTGDEQTDAVLAGLVAQCDTLERGWHEVDAFCARLPRTVVHGDFAALNVRIRRDARGATILPFDWEKAGYAVPVVDMARGLDLDTYWLGIRDAWRALTLDDVHQMALLARVFRPLSHNWARKTPKKLHDHYLHMQHTIGALGWTATHEMDA
jgi:hypothetical protein